MNFDNLKTVQIKLVIKNKKGLRALRRAIQLAEQLENGESWDGQATKLLSCLGYIARNMKPEVGKVE